jgi:hypothetical protein
VVFTSPDKSENIHFERKNKKQFRHNVTLFGDDSLNEYVKSIDAEIKPKVHYTQLLARCIGEIEEEVDPAAHMECQKIQVELDEARKAIEELHAFYNLKDVSIRWATPQSRIGGKRITWPNIISGHVILSPPIELGTQISY